MLLLNVQVTDYANTTKITTCLRIAMCQTFTEKKKKHTTKQNSRNKHLSIWTLRIKCFEVFHYLKTSVSKPWHDLISSRQFCFY